MCCGRQTAVARAEGLPQDPRVKHLQRLHRQRRSRAVGQSRDAGQLLLAFLLLGIILGVLLTVPGHGVVPAWVHQLTHSLQEDRVGMLPPPQGRWRSAWPVATAKASR
jgi:hypothetical protein